MVGYSLVGVYPCAVWKPQSCPCAGTDAGGAIRSRLASTVRSAPYPQPASLYQAEPCRCRAPEETTCEAAQAPAPASTTPMLFVPFSVPSYGPHLALASNNSVSPSGGTTPIIKVTLNSNTDIKKKFEDP